MNGDAAQSFGAAQRLHAAAGFMDYIVGDDIVTPAECAPHFSEKFLRMADSYYVTNDAEEVADDAPSRAAAGLAEEGFVFACFSQSYKIEPSVFQVWLRLWQGMPASVLWLFSSNPAQRQNLLAVAKQGGVDGGRICFAENWPSPAIWRASGWPIWPWIRSPMGVTRPPSMPLGALFERLGAR